MKQKAARWIFYFSGLVILSLGIILNTKSKFGVTPIISVAYSYALIKHLNFGNVSFILYVILAVIEYLVKGKNFKLYDLLQIPLSVILTRFFNLFGVVLPDVSSMPARILCLILGIALTGIGAAMNVNTRLVPNPGDGIVQAIADRVKQRIGNVKNVFDLGCVAFCCLMSYFMTGSVVGIGIGTVAAMIGVGRFMWLYNQFFKARQLSATGLTQ
jgi:uncharacterized membrane protein YczE